MRIKLIFVSTFITIAGLFVVNCGNSDEAVAKTDTEAGSHNEELYTCGMHPNVIQEGPGNCPICGMKLTPLNGGSETSQAESGSSSTPGEKKILYYRAPMDPSYISPKPGKSPMGMDLVPVYAGEETFGATVKINPVVEQNMGVRIASVQRHDLYREIRTVGRVDYDESLLSHIHTKFTGWIEKAYVSTTGEKIRKGEKLVEIYSPQLVTAQQEYLDAYNSLKHMGQSNDPSIRSNAAAILQSSRIRLEYFDISDGQIQALEQTGQVKKTVTIQSPFEGYVVEKHVVDGMEVKPGMQMYTIADLSQIWVYADIYEYELPWLAEGQKAEMSLSYLPGETFKGIVNYVYPYLDSKSRTIKARLKFSNPKMTLKPGMYANIKIESSPVKNVIAVPLEAVLFSGERSLVFVALGGGRFAPRPVVVGMESGNGFYEIKSGLDQGDQVVLSGQFLLDSESRLQEGISKLLGNRTNKANSPESNEKPGAGGSNERAEKANNPANRSRATGGHEHGEEDADAPISPEKFGEVRDGMLTWYTCPMESHAFVKVNHPGDCPECGMKLVEKTEKYDSTKTWYTCPMPEHHYVVEDHAGKCPVCEMTLVPIKPEQGK